MRKNIQIVIAAFLRGEYANEKTCWTDGKAIYSYKMMIAKRSPLTGQVLLLDRKVAPSNTTRSQIDAASCVLDAMIVPDFDRCYEHADCAAHASGAPDLGAECAARS